jgi:hypothetical protein
VSRTPDSRATFFRPRLDVCGRLLLTRGPTRRRSVVANRNTTALCPHSCICELNCLAPVAAHSPRTLAAGGAGAAARTLRALPDDRVGARVEGAVNISPQRHGPGAFASNRCPPSPPPPLPPETASTAAVQLSSTSPHGAGPVERRDVSRGMPAASPCNRHCAAPGRRGSIARSSERGDRRVPAPGGEQRTCRPLHGLGRRGGIAWNGNRSMSARAARTGPGTAPCAAAASCAVCER